MPPRNRQRRSPEQGPTASQAWSGVEGLLQQLAAANSTATDWAEAGMGVVALQSLMEAQPSTAWPTWLLTKLAATVSRGLRPDIMGMSGQQPRTAALFGSNSGANDGQVVVVLNLMCAIGEMICRLAEVLHAVRDDAAPQLKTSEAELLGMLTNTTSLLPNVGTAAGHLAAFCKTHKVLKEKDTADRHKASVVYCFVGLASGLLNLWINIHDTMPSIGLLSAAPPTVMQTVQPIITLAVTVLQAYPGPAAAAGAPHPGSQQPRTAYAAAGAANMTATALAERAAAGGSSAASSTLQSAVAAASAAAGVAGAGSTEAVPAEELSAAWVYKTQCLPQVMHVAEAFTEAVEEELWSRAVGSPVSALKPDTPARVLELLQDKHVKLLVAFNLLVVTASLHRYRSGARCLDPSEFPINSRSSRTGRGRRRQQRQGPTSQQQPQGQQEQAPGQQQQQPEVEPMHEKLEKVMGLSGCMQQLLSRTQGSVDGLNGITAMQCCLGASLAAQGRAPLGPVSGRVVSGVAKTELVPKGFSEPLMCVLTEMMMMTDDLQLLLFALHLIQGLISAERAPLGALTPLVGSLAPYVVQGVRTADSNKSWSALDGTGMDIEVVRGAMLEGAGNLVYLLLDPHVLTAEGLTALCNMTSQQPTATLSTFDALLRARAEAEAANKVYSRRVQLHSQPHGTQFPELLRTLQQITCACMTEIHETEFDPATSAAEQVLDSPASAGAAMVGLFVSAQKYSLRALHKAPALSAWDATALATLQMLALHVVAATAAEMPVVAKSAAQLSHQWPVIWTAAADAATAAAFEFEDDGSDDEDWEPGTGFKLVAGDDHGVATGSALADRLGSLLVPVLQLYARSLLLLTKALQIPPEALSLGMAAHSPAVVMWMGEHRMQLKPELLVATCFLTTQFMELLLPQLQEPVAAAAAGAAAGGDDAPCTAAAGGNGSSGVSSRAPTPAVVIPAAVLDQLLQQAAACTQGLADIKAKLDQKAKEPKRETRKSADELLQLAKKPFAVQASSRSSSEAGPPVLQLLQQFAVDLLAQLPSKFCTNPNCTQLGYLSEKDLCEKRCGACKTAYCSKECSRQHWKQHKPLCQRLTAATVAAATAAPAATAQAAAGQQP